MLHWQRKWIIVQIDFWNWRDLYSFLGALYGLALVVVEWLYPGTLAPLNLWKPETWLSTLWRGN